MLPPRRDHPRWGQIREEQWGHFIVLRPRRGRPRTKGARLGTADDIAAAAAWDTVTVTAYGREHIKHVTAVT